MASPSLATGVSPRITRSPAARSRVLGLLVLAACSETASPTASSSAPAEPVPASVPAEPAVPPPAEARARELVVLDFDAASPGTVAPGFTVAETHGVGSLARWTVRAAPDAPSGEHVFGIAESVNRGQTYNLAVLSDRSDLEDVELQVMIHAGSGVQDRGGGLVFRFRDPDNYYVVRWNPLEGNVRFYKVVNSERKPLAEAKLDRPGDAWHELRVLAVGDRFELWVDDASVLTAQDGALVGPGTVGLWSKADAAPWFDDFTVTPL